MMMGTVLWWRSVRQASNPSIPGSIRSMRTSSKGSSVNRLTASSPLATSSTVYPSSSSARRMEDRIRSSSSTIRMRLIASIMARPPRRSGAGRRPAEVRS